MSFDARILTGVGVLAAVTETAISPARPKRWA